MTAEQVAEGVKLYRGNCLTIAPTLTGVDAIVADPPYGMNWDTDITRFTGGNNKANRQAGRNDAKPIGGDAEPFDPSPWLLYPKVVLFGYNHFAKFLPVGTVLVWVKKNEAAYGTFLSDAELIWMKGGKGVYLHRDLSMNAETKRRVHPTQKPVSLMRWVIRRLKLKPNSLILDPYAGSGTTALAAVAEGHRCILIESHDPYCDVIRTRMTGSR